MNNGHFLFISKIVTLTYLTKHIKIETLNIGGMEYG